MLTNFALRAKVLILIGALIAVCGAGDAVAQEQENEDRRQAQPQQRGQAQPQQRGRPQQRGQARPQGRGQAQSQQRGQARSRRSGQGQQQGGQAQTQQEPQQSEPFIHGISVGAGLAIYQGDFSRNPEHNPIVYVAGSGKLSVKVGADHRLGRFDQYGVGADLVYSRLSGTSTRETGFSVNSVALDFYGDYELPYVRQGLFRVFLGGGPTFLISPSYKNFENLARSEENSSKKGTRVIGSLKVGVTVLDKFEFGTRIASTDLLDGYEGFGGGGGVPDIVSFLNFTYRFNRK